MKLKFVLLFLFITLKGFGQNSFEINGLVTDINNKPIGYVHLYLEGSKIGTVTNEDGKFRLKIPKRLCKKKILVSHTAYESYSQELNCREKSPTAIKLIESVMMLEEMNIVADLSAKQIVYNAIKNLEKNFKVDSVNYTIFSRYTEKEKIENKPLLIEESVYNLYHNEKTKPKFNIIKVRGNGFERLGKRRFNQARLIGIHSTASHIMLRYLANFLEKGKIKKYKYEILREQKFEKKYFYVIKVTSNNYLKGGEIWIEKESYGIAYLKQVYKDEKWRTMSKLNTVHESYYKQSGDKWFFSYGTRVSDLYLKKENTTITRKRITVATNRVAKSVFEKSEEMGLMSKMLKDFRGSFADKFWDNYNYIPLDKVFTEAIKNIKKE